MFQGRIYSHGEGGFLMGNALSVKEAAGRCGVSVFAMRRWIAQRRLSVFKLGRRVVVGEADLAAFLAAHRVEARQRGAQGDAR